MADESTPSPPSADPGVADAPSGAGPGPAADATLTVADPFASTLPTAAAAAPKAPCLEPGRELGPVRLVREIGRGATGAVFQGHHTVLGRDVAVKFLLHVAAGADREGLRRFVDEARAAAAVRHPNLTQIFHADVDEGTPYLVLEYVQGPTLRQLLEHAGALSVTVAAAAVGDIAAAVAELHARGIIHRDIKPSNALVDDEGRVCVTDFGLAVRRSHGTTAADIDFAGTPAYMAPEMFEGRVSPRSDVYALGVTTYQLITGTTPFSGSFHELRDRHAHEPLPADRLRQAGVPAEVIDVIERATNKQAMFRYKTAPDFARALRQAAGCGVPELARARKQLCDLVAGRAHLGTPPAGGALSSAGEMRLPGAPGAARDHDTDTTLYTQTISRIATVKRERRRQPTDHEGSSTNLPGPPTDTPPPPSTSPAAAAAPAAAAPSAPAPAPSPASPDRAVPGPVLSIGVLGILYGTLAALWVAGILSGSSTLRPTAPTGGQGATAVRIVLMLAAVAYFLLGVTLVPAAVGCLQLKRWARRLMVLYAAGDLLLQLAVLLLAIAWVEPATVNQLAAKGQIATSAERAAVEAPILREWALQWCLLSVFPAVTLFVITRRRVREAFRQSARETDAAVEFSAPSF